MDWIFDSFWIGSRNGIIASISGTTLQYMVTYQLLQKETARPWCGLGDRPSIVDE